MLSRGLLLGLLLGAEAFAGRPSEPRPASAPGNAATTAQASDPTATLVREPPGDLDRTIPRPQAEAAALKREAVAVATQVVEAYPNDALAYALLGSAYYNTGQAERAAEHLRKCLELNPGLAEAYAVLARIAYDKGEPEESVRLFRQALQRGPGNPEVLNRLGRALLDLGRTAEAVSTLEQAVALPGRTSESCYLLGQAQLQSGKPAQAKEAFQRAIALLPDHTQAFFGLYTACLRLGQTEEAGRYREQFQKLEATDRRSLTDRNAQEDTLTGLPLVGRTVARTLFGAAQVYGSHQEGGKAAGLLRRAASLDPESPMYRAALEAYYVRTQAVAEAVAVFEQLAAEQPTNSLNHLFLGRLQGRLQQFEAAERAYRKVQELAPQWAEGYRALAEFYLRANRKLAEAMRLAEQAVELEPSGPHHYLLAVLRFRNDDRVGALKEARQAVALSPEVKDHQEFLEYLEGRGGR